MKRVFNIETIKKTGDKVLLKGWVHRRRNMGKIVFIDLRDKTGLIQVVLVPKELDEASNEVLPKIRPEYVVSIEGIVNERPKDQYNKEMAVHITMDSACDS